MLRRFVCLLVLLTAAFGAGAQPATNDGLRQPRILLLVDASSSMLEPWSPKATRFQTAGNIVLSLMDSIYAVNAGVEFGLRVYGHQSPAQNNDCFDSRQEVMFSKNNWTQMSLRLASITPFGVSPIAYSLQEAANNDLVDEVRNAYSIILITDGGESCGGNICDVVKQLIERKIYFKPYIISLVDYAPLRQQYACLGTYLMAAKPEDIPTAIHTIVEAYRPQLSAPIMIVKVDTPKKQNIQTINIPSWIPERSTVQQLTISIPRSQMQVSTYRPLLHTMAVPTTAHVSKPIAEPVIPTWEPKHSTVAQLSMFKPKTVFPASSYSPWVHAVVLPTSAPVSKPPAEPVVIPPHKPETLSNLKIAAWRPVSIVTPIAYMPARRNENTLLTLPAIQHEPETIATLNSISKQRLLTTSATRIPGALARLNPFIPIKLPEIPAEKRDTIVAVKTIPKRDTATKTTVVIKSIERPKPVVKLPATASSSKPKETSFTKETEDAKETSLSILFTDGRGKFYASTPQLQLLDAASGKLVKQFYRTVDPDGNPDPQIIPPGTYNLLVAGRANMLMRRVTVEANKKNKVTIRVTNGSLRFEYYEAPNRPITEFEAIVNIRFEPGPTIRQHCTAELEYPPGNYYIEVNTMPITRFNVDIDFGATSVVYIPEPGFIQFTNATPKGYVALFAPLGDRFVRFADLNVTGNLSAQRLMLKPGAYEAHWVKNPNLPNATETIEHFNVKSNSVTEVELH